MFQFTTTNLINTNQDYTSKKPRWAAQDAKDGKPASFSVLRVAKFLKPNVTAIYKAAAIEPEMAKVTIDLANLSGTPGDSFRLNLYIGLTQASQQSHYANDLIFKGKPISVDFMWKKSAVETAQALTKVIKKFAAFTYGEKLLNISNSGSFITIEATTEYQRFKRVNLEKFDTTNPLGGGEYKVLHSLEDIPVVNSNAEVTAAAEGIFVGREGFGTYSYIMHNLRIPTAMNTRYFRPLIDETPIVGAKYNQYTVHYCADRGELGMNAVGDTVKSKTTHVFFVNQDIADAFEAALVKVAPEAGIVEIPKKKTMSEGAAVSKEPVSKDPADGE